MTKASLYRLERRARKILDLAGITIGGNEPYDIIVDDQEVYREVFRGGPLRLAELYMGKRWRVRDENHLHELFVRLLSEPKVRDALRSLRNLPPALWALFKNQQTVRRARKVGEVHYDIGNELYEPMLGPTMAYSCGYWPPHVRTLDEAQEAKYDLVCRKLGLKPGMTVLEVGCGWGGFLLYAAKKYGIRGVGITISKEQAEYARKACKDYDIEIRLEDYRKTTGVYDRIVSIGMFEHVGPKNYRVFMRKMRELLAPKGLLLLHTIVARRKTLFTDGFMAEYIFPNGKLPSLTEIFKAADKIFQATEDVHNFGNDYEPTLLAWLKNFDEAWPELHAKYPEKYDERFRLMWRYYLSTMAAAFGVRRTHLCQFVFARVGVAGGYESVR